ncbi:hypothetical protein [Bacillus massilinigeriensis]|uniref:hypothetical protein n=1 Tax=Bacillus massilionigeriensis TaxID=1805475 RepID=UPI00114D4922|nr:hypothetical protein [Bacillus massilionigeriensis]
MTRCLRRNIGTYLLIGVEKDAVLVHQLTHMTLAAVLTTVVMQILELMTVVATVNYYLVQRQTGFMLRLLFT